MIPTGPALPCPKCKRVLGSDSWHDSASGKCRGCREDFEFFAFPALTAQPKRATAQTALEAEESVCFFHAGNRAEAVCDDCGRLICAVCSIGASGRKVCPSCISATKKAGAPTVVRERMLHDSTALGLTLLPLLVWPLTLVTAPLALGFTIYGWKKPSSLVRGRSRVKLIAAGIIAVVQIGAWVTLGAFLLNKR